MKPAPFGYAAPDTVDEALSILASDGADARLIAGGQSLGPLLNLRIAAPGLVVDLNRVEGLDGITVGSDGSLRLGAMVRQRAAEISPEVAGWPVLAEAISHIGHRAIRNRGTIGGSVAHADPAAELPASLVALDAVLAVRSASATRSVLASEFFVGPFTTVLAPDEMLVEIVVPAAPARTGYSWMEVARRHGDFGIIGVAAVVGLDSDGRCAAAKVVCSGADWTPWSDPDATGMLIGRSPTVDRFSEVGARMAEASSPPDDIHASSDHRRRLIGVLTARALAKAAADAGVGP